MNTLVLGSAGFLGLNLVDALLAHGIRPLCGRRKSTNVIPLRNRRVPMIEAHLSDVASLAAAMRDVELVFHLAGHYPRHSLDRAAAIHTGLSELENVFDAAARARVRHVVYVSSMSTVAPAPMGPSNESHRYANAPGFGTYHDLKWHMEERARAENRFNVSIACPGACIGPWDLRIGTSALLVGIARGLNPPHPDGFVNLVDSRDVAEALVAIAKREAAVERVLLAAHNDRLHALLALLASRYGGPLPHAPLSADEARDLADREERDYVATQKRPMLSREIVDLVIHGVAVNASFAETSLGMRWRPLEQTLDAFDDWARRMRILPERTRPSQESQELGT